MPDYLLEIGTEELPAAHIPEAQSKIEELLNQELTAANLDFSSIKTYATPRRLAAIVAGLGEKQETVSKKIKGPPAKSAYKDGVATPAAEGFAKKHGLTVKELGTETMGKEDYLVANVTIEGKSAREVLSEIVPKVIARISGERLMRWADYDIKFSRPIRWIASLLDGEVVRFDLEGVTVSNRTFGHRILAPASIELNSADAYVGTLKKVCVMVDPEERKSAILQQVEFLSKKVSGKSKQLSGPLLSEVVNITEWPHAVIGDFSDEYLALPAMLLETIMVHHQRYFPVERENTSDCGTSVKSNNLLPHFITVANNDSPSAQATIKQGNERVLKARLADGKFFFFDDQRLSLVQRAAELDHLTFQEGLGSYKDKVERLKRLAGKLTNQLRLDAKLSVCLERTMELCKLDLVTNLVRELPELQGFVGAWYCELAGEPAEVVRAISSHYSPRHTDDPIPSDTVGCFTALLDKIDHLAGLFALGKRPSGSSDPFALRRQAQGLVDILIDGVPQYPINLSLLLDQVVEEFRPVISRSKKNIDVASVRAELDDFIMQRLRGKLLDMKFGREIVDAVLANHDPLINLADVVVRLHCLDELVRSDSQLALVRAGVRVGNILSPDSPDQVDSAAFSEPVEEELWKEFTEKVKNRWESTGQFKTPSTKEEYDELLSLLKPLAPTIDKFFVAVLVNDPDATKKNLRHAMLKNIDKYFSTVARFSKLQPILP